MSEVKLSDDNNLFLQALFDFQEEGVGKENLRLHVEGNSIVLELETFGTAKSYALNCINIDAIKEKILFALSKIAKSAKVCEYKIAE